MTIYLLVFPVKIILRDNFKQNGEKPSMVLGFLYFYKRGISIPRGAGHLGMTSLLGLRHRRRLLPGFNSFMIFG
jgi:hypothetical protein